MGVSGKNVNERIQTKLIKEKMKKKGTQLWMVILLMIAVNCGIANAQVVIGSTTEPNAAAILDLSKKDAGANTSLGLLLPNVALSSDTAVLSGGNEEGLLVYCPGPGGGAAIPKGLYVWNGTAWKAVILA
jgi:hypothetical protein